MAQNVDFTTYEGLFQKVYEKKLVRTVPAFTDCQKEIQFTPRARTGDSYNIPLALQLEAGITWALQSDGAFALEVPIAGVMKQATIKGSCHCIRSAIAYVAAFGGEEPQQAFENTTGSTVKNAYEAMRMFLEMDILYGQDTDGIGVIEKIAGEAAVLPATGNVPANAIQISVASWASGLWVEGAKVEVFDTGHTVIRNAAAPTITKVDLDTRIITLDTIPAAAVDTDVVHYKTQCAVGGGGTFKTMAGLKKILTNTGTIFGIDAGTYNKWKGNTYACGSAPLSFGKIGRAMTKVLAKGGQGNRFILWCSGPTWTDLNADVDALRTDDTGSYKPGAVELGHERITYHTVCGPVEIRAHAMVKESEAIIIPQGGFDRIGSTDITFDRSKMTGLSKSGPGNFLLELASNAGFEFRGFDHQAIISEKPGFCVFFSGITNSTPA